MRSLKSFKTQMKKVGFLNHPKSSERYDETSLNNQIKKIKSTEYLFLINNKLILKDFLYLIK